eukprot:2385779-Ditylum_brightwellii.AAC.1
MNDKQYNYGRNKEDSWTEIIILKEDSLKFKEALGKESEVKHSKDTGWTCTGKNRHHGSTKRGKTNRKVELNTKENQMVENIKKMMKGCREMAVDAKARYQTGMQIKWMLADGCKMFNACRLMITVLEKM